MITIPFPDNPLHVANLASFELLEAQGFEGPDKSLYISLKDYSIAWWDLGEDILFIYAIHGTARYDRATVPKSLDLKKEYTWIKWSNLMDYVGCVDFEEWAARDLATKICDLVSYYGAEEIFGTSYWPGFEIK